MTGRVILLPLFKGGTRTCELLRLSSFILQMDLNFKIYDSDPLNTPD